MESEHIHFIIINTILNQTINGITFESIDEGCEYIDEMDDEDLAVIPAEYTVH